jgi:hypothetical protein
MNPGTFTTLRSALAPMDWSDIVAMVSDHARSQGLRWDDAAREVAQAVRDQAESS